MFKVNMLEKEMIDISNQLIDKIYLSSYFLRKPFICSNKTIHALKILSLPNFTYCHSTKD